MKPTWAELSVTALAQVLCRYEVNGRELELELIQSHMTQKPVLRGEVGYECVAREVSVERGGMGERGCARRLGGWPSLLWCSPAGAMQCTARLRYVLETVLALEHEAAR